MANRYLIPGLRRFNIQFGASCLWASRAFSVDVMEEKLKLRGNLNTQILGLKSGNRSPFSVFQNWVDQGKKLSISELRHISSKLIKLKRYDHALEVMSWMERQKNFQVAPADHAWKLELLIKISGLAEAEKYFMRIPDSASQKAVCLPLLRRYVRDRDTSKAEAFMVKLYELGLVLNPHPYNEMMKLYIAKSEYEKVPLVIQQMKRNKIPLNVLSYNLWMNVCIEKEGYGVAAAEMVFREMRNDENVEVGWSSLATLANVYIKAGQSGKAILVLENAEKKLSTCNRLGFFFLMTLYASLKNEGEVLRLWEASKAVGGRITCANYICVLSCLVRIGNLVQAERIFRQWEANCRNYDVRVSNVLLGAYMRNGSIEKAESLHMHTLERGARPNYKTWEIMVEGFVKIKQMDKAIIAMKKAFSMFGETDWRPSHGLVMTIAEHFEKNGNLEDANQYVRDIHYFGLASLSLYKMLLRMHLAANKPVVHVLIMMDKDHIIMDVETLAILGLHA